MKIELKSIPIRALTDAYADKADQGVTGYGGRLNIRPAFQREFVYKDKQRDEVINTVRKDFPLNTLYWAVAGDGFELMDGQQRTVSICQYVQGDYSVVIDGSPKFFNNLTSEKQAQILDYKLSVYVCEGTEGEKLDWFKIINIAGEKLTNQELRNAIYTGPWLADAKRWFSRTGGPAYSLGERYLNGTPLRQEYLEKSLEWISSDKIEDYMSIHQHNTDAQELWQYFQEVIAWVQRIFPNYRKDMKGLDWGGFYNAHKGDKFNAATLEQCIVVLIEDDDVDNKKGIYGYLLTGNKKTLNLRAFSEKIQVTQYEKQKGICPVCGQHFERNGMEADHIIPWGQGGSTKPKNCQMLCKMDNRTKSGK